MTGMLALAFNLRAAITSLPPVFPELQSSLHLPSAAIAALAAVPVLCFAVFSPVAAPLSRRFGEERVMLAALVLLAAGLLARGALPGVLLYPGTVVATSAIALMNVLLPSLVKRRRPGQAGLLIGTYLLSMSAGSVIGSLIAVPVYQASGGSIPLTLGLWALPALAAALAWLPQWRYRTAPASPDGGPRLRTRPVKMSRHLLAWQVMGFMGLQSLTYYTALSWLPTLFRDRGAGAVHAGFLLALMNLGGAPTALLAPVLAQRARDQRLLVLGTVLVSAAGLAGAWFAPLSTAVFWTLLLGVGQGAALGLAIYSPPRGRRIRSPPPRCGVRPGRRVPDRGDWPAGLRLPARGDRELDGPRGRAALRVRGRVRRRPPALAGPGPCRHPSRLRPERRNVTNPIL